MKLAIFGAGALALMTATAAAQSPIYGSWPPASDYLNTDALPDAFKQIEEETGGSLTWELIAGGQLADGRGTLAAVQDDLMQAGLQIPVYNPEAMPSFTMLYSIVVPGDNTVAVAAAAAETVFLHCPSCLEDARKNNVVAFGGFASASYRLMCTSPVASIAAMSGKRIRATGGFAEIASLAGATPTSTTLTDAVGLLQKGGLECLMATREWLQTYGYGEYAKYVTDLPLGNSAPAIGFLMNRDRFMSMSKDEQKAMMRASARVTAKHTIGNYVVRDEQSFQNQVKENGVELVEPADDLKSLVEGFAKADRERLIKTGKQLGVDDPATLIDTYLAAVEKWKPIAAEAGNDVDALTQRLWDEVFSKVDPSSL